MSAATYRVGIIGLGPVAIRASRSEDLPPVIQETMRAEEGPAYAPFGQAAFMSHVWAMTHLPELDIAAVCDVNPARIARFRHNWGHAWPNASGYADLADMLSREQLDVVTVATPEHLHAGPVIAAAERGVRAIFCEKPLATSVADADRMIAACEANGAMLCVDYTRRWQPIFHSIRDSIRAGRIGEVSLMTASFGGTQAWLFRSASHLLDAMAFFAEAAPAQASAHLEDGYDDWDRYRGSGGGNATERDPGGTGYVVFESGARGALSFLKNAPDFQRQITITGTKGMITHAFDSETAEIATADPANAYRAIRSTLEAGVYRSRGLEAAYRDIVDCLANSAEIASPAREARKSVAIMEAFLISHQQGGRLVRLP